MYFVRILCSPGLDYWQSYQLTQGDGSCSVLLEYWRDIVCDLSWIFSFLGMSSCFLPQAFPSVLVSVFRIPSFVQEGDTFKDFVFLPEDSLCEPEVS